MKKNTLSLLILISGILISGGIIGLAHAQTTTSTDQTESLQQQKNLSNLQYPIAELGNCVDKASCKTYCDKPENVDACLSFAGKNNLMQKAEIDAAKKFEDSGRVGPGGCQGQVACEQYCGDSTKLEECTAFAEKNGMISDQQLQDSKKVVAAIKSGLKPPACTGPEQCNAYCSSSQHMEECITFSLAAGVVPDDQKEQMQKTLTAFKQGIKPPACQPNPPDQSKQSGQPTQVNQPSQFGQGLQACDQYCADPSHVEECVKFSVAIGNMTEEQGQSSIKNGGKGPGGCIGKDACNTFCNNPDNQETCFNFGKDNGMIPQEDLQKMQDGQQKMKDSFSQIPQEVLDCLTSSVGSDVVEKMKNGSFVPQKAGDSINQCFQKNNSQGQTQNQNQPGQNQQIEPWADMCKPDANGNPTALACVDGSGNFVASAKVGSDGQPVCPTGSTAKCGNYQQQNGQGQQNQNGQGQPGQGGGGQGDPNQPGQPGGNGSGDPNQPGQLFREKLEPKQPKQPGGPGDGQGPGNGAGQGQGGPGNNGGGGGQSGWSNGTGNGGGNGGPGGPGAGGPPVGGTNQGPGNGAGQGQGGPGNNGGGGGQSGGGNGGGGSGGGQ